jgi:nucleoside-diphosphate-sugar epimerase
MRIIVTGSKGGIGSAVVDYAKKHGADVLGVDNVGAGDLRDYISADMTDLGQVYDVLHGADAVVHLAAIRNSRMYPNARTFMANIGATYNVFLAAAHLGIKRVVTASTIQVSHIVRPRTPLAFHYFPFDEAHPLSVHEDYTLSKYVGEVLADTFSAQWGLTIVSLRYTGVVTHDNWPHLPRKLLPHTSMPYPHYVHVDDAARCTFLAATADLPADSHTVAFVTARDTAIDMPSDEWIERYFPWAERRIPFTGHEALVSGQTAAEKLGFVAEHSWRTGQAGPNAAAAASPERTAPSTQA